MSRNKDHIRVELESTGLRGVELENQIIVERSKGKDYGLERMELIGAYTHKYYKELRLDGDRVSADKVRQKNPDVVDEAHRTLKNCIDSGYIEEKEGKLYLHGKGRMFADQPQWKNPFSCNEEEKWNMRLIIEYVKAVGPFWGAIAFIITTALAYYLGTLKQ